MIVDNHLDDYKLVELQDFAKRYGLKNFTKLKKLELIEYILKSIRTNQDEDAFQSCKDLDDFLKKAKSASSKKASKDKKDEKNIKSAPNTIDGIETVPANGILEILPDGFGFLRRENYSQSDHDYYVSPTYIKKFHLRQGDEITGVVRKKDEANEENTRNAIVYINKVNGDSLDVCFKRADFDELVPEYPDKLIKLETTKDEVSTRFIDLISPIGKGQRGLIVAPPKAGKTTLIKKIANAININHPEIKLIVLLIDERPEEVTDLKRSINGDIIYSTFDDDLENHIKVSQMTLERAKRLVEHKKDVVILLDSITRLARAYNMTIAPTGRSLSGGLDPGALFGPKKFFGAARNFKDAGSLTILATALIDTGSRMDQVIYEEFKGTGNMELYLDRELSNMRLFPAIDILNSGTRKDELLLDEKTLNIQRKFRVMMKNNGNEYAVEFLRKFMTNTSSNKELVDSLDKALIKSE
ncbi:transcription termination factor Rho [Fenollaria sporofastidiosus]|uniref:transcription termination factor Rho n=1 Tax=Fenollaria sporofastidiosus TaxID=2811778 RepID=UPI001BFFFAAF|nr:transcription termination factor Rho [Fenollaria sporofastidiosus]